MRASIDALQIYLGTEEHFFKVQAHKIELRPNQKANQIVYMWEELTMLGCQLVSDIFWTPKNKGINDRSIIDAVTNTMHERQGTSNHFPRKALWYVNACCLYLKVTMLHEISTECGKFIQTWAMDGSRTNPKNTLVYPHQERPPLQA